MDDTIARDDMEKKVEADVEQDVGKDVDEAVEYVMEEATDALNKTVKADISDESMRLKLKAKITQDVKHNLSEYIKNDVKNDVANDVERDVQQSVSPVIKDYAASGEIDIPSLQDLKLKKQFAAAWPSLFCWCVMMTVGNNPLGWMEESLIKQQLDLSIGIFACNEWAVITDDRLALNRWGEHGFPKIPEGIDTDNDTLTWAIGSTTVAKGAQTNPLNSGPFQTAWKALQRSKRLDNHDWVVKVDPDTVWFPVRLRSHLQTYMPGHGNGRDNIFLKNCPRFNSMQGPVEVISRKGAINLENNIQNCGGVWGVGEDHFMVACVQQLGVSPIMEAGLLNDKYCDGYVDCSNFMVACVQQLGVSPFMEAGLLNDKYCDGYVDCSNTWKVAFHPHKNPTNFLACYNTSMKVDVH
eukprot:CAMPEP_0172928618 /NCGR_PEP_ID=MMETSP1075-20121228/218069_1 /TAXON_ID=2916 /ORGANISM="Ceratium fusus, Strain PA161109" /LENGTH=409 /DNA_ID=CAMNT_0013789905 /DNA_START=236 /DNA_END=1465 /DNA_ORIENTATION=-